MWRQARWDELERMPPQRRMSYINRRLRSIVEHAYKNAPAVKERFDSIGLDPSSIRTVENLERIPVTPKHELPGLQSLNPPFGGFLTIPPDQLKSIWVSPGPTYVPNTPRIRNSHARGYYLTGFRKGDIVQIAAAYHLVPGGTLASDAFNILGITYVPVGTGNSELQLQIMRELKVSGFVGAPSFLMNLIKIAESQGYDFRRDFRLRHALISFEITPPALRKSLEDDYGIGTMEFYATADLGALGYECSTRHGMHIPPDAIVEIVDPETGDKVAPGEIGEIVGTVFDDVYPLIRFGTGDLSSYTDQPCPCGRTSPRLLGIVGRVGEAVRVKSMFLHAREVERAFSKFNEISKFQIVVSRPELMDEITILAELKEGELVDKTKLMEEIDVQFKEACRLRANRIEFVARGVIPETHKTIVDQRRLAN